MNRYLFFLVFVGIFSFASFAATTNVGINITSLVSITVYTSNGSADSAFSFIGTPAPSFPNNYTLYSNNSLNTSDGTGNRPGETGFTIRNDGNINVTIQIKSNSTATEFIGGTAPGYYFVGVNNETDSCSTSAGILTSTITAMSTADGTYICNTNGGYGGLGYDDVSDTLNATIIVAIVSDSPPGTRQATLTFTATAIS